MAACRLKLKIAGSPKFKSKEPAGLLKIKNAGSRKFKRKKAACRLKLKTSHLSIMPMTSSAASSWSRVMTSMRPKRIRLKSSPFRRYTGRSTFSPAAISICMPMPPGLPTTASFKHIMSPPRYGISATICYLSNAGTITTQAIRSCMV